MRTDVSPVAPPPGGATARVRRWSGIGLRILAAAYCWALLWLLVWTIVPRAFGWSPNVIESGSMAPLIRVGDVVVTEPGVELDDLAAGQIVTFTDPIDGQLTTHRIEAVEADELTTKGDANQVADTTPVEGADVQGRARIVVPAVGLPRVWLDEGRLAVTIGWIALTLGALWLSLSPVRGFPDRSDREDRARRHRPLGRPAIAGGLAVLVALGVGPSSRAVFGSVTDNAANLFTAAADFGYSLYADEVATDNPEAYWRLGETGVLPAPVFVEDFETWSGWNQYGSGTVAQTSTWAHGGSAALMKNLNNDPNGGWKLVGTPLPDTWTLETWLYRPSGWTGGSIDRVGIEDASFNGYSFGANHSGNTLFIDRRTGGAGTSLVATAFNPPEDGWYRLVLSRSVGTMTVEAFDGLGTLLATAATSDPAYSSFDRVVIHGGYQYAVDDISIWDAAVDVSTARDETTVHDAPYVGGPARGQAGLLAGDANTAARFDGVDDTVAVPDHAGINTSRIDQRTVELWYQADSAARRQVLFEEGGGGNGINVYLDNGLLYARAWSNPWSNDLEVSRPVTPTTSPRHVVAVVDAVGDTLTLYVDGALGGTSTKTDGWALNAHSGNIGIASMQGATRFHDGNAGGNGNYFAGVIDEVALYNSALSATRIGVHHAVGT